MKRLLLVIWVIACSAVCYSQSVDITIRFPFSATDTLMFGYYKGNLHSMVVMDTIVLQNGQYSIIKDDLLPLGVYYIEDSGVEYSFIVSENQKFVIEIDKGIFPIQKTTIGSIENQDYFEYLDFEESSDSLMRFQTFLSQKHTDSYLGRLMKAITEVEIPDPPFEMDVSDRMMFFLQWYRAHFFDNFDSSNPELLRTPYYDDKILEFFDEVLPMLPDTIKHYADKLIEPSLASPDVFNHLTTLLLYHYQDSDWILAEEIWVHLVEKWILPYSDIWEETRQLDYFKDELKYRKPNLVGQIAPPMDLDVYVFKDILKASKHNALPKGHVSGLDPLLTAKFNFVIFWDPDCGHCLDIIPSLHETLELFSKQDINVIAIMVVELPESVVKWVETVKNMNLTNWYHARSPRSDQFKWDYNILNTPSVFVLDENGKILIKNFDTDQILEIIKMLFLTHKS